MSVNPLITNLEIENESNGQNYPDTFPMQGSCGDCHHHFDRIRIPLRQIFRSHVDVACPKCGRCFCRFGGSSTDEAFMSQLTLTRQNVSAVPFSTARSSIAMESPPPPPPSQGPGETVPVDPPGLLVVPAETLPGGSVSGCPSSVDSNLGPFPTAAPSMEQSYDAAIRTEISAPPAEKVFNINTRDSRWKSLRKALAGLMKRKLTRRNHRISSRSSRQSTTVSSEQGRPPPKAPLTLPVPPTTTVLPKEDCTGILESLEEHTPAETAHFLRIREGHTRRAKQLQQQRLMPSCQCGPICSCHPQYGPSTNVLRSLTGPFDRIINGVVPRSPSNGDIPALAFITANFIEIPIPNNTTQDTLPPAAFQQEPLFTPGTPVRPPNNRDSSATEFSSVSNTLYDPEVESSNRFSRGSPSTTHARPSTDIRTVRTIEGLRSNFLQIQTQGIGLHPEPNVSGEDELTPTTARRPLTDPSLDGFGDQFANTFARTPRSHRGRPRSRAESP